MIGTVRRECLDRILFWCTADLEVKLLDFKHYYNGHSGLEGRLPEPTVEGSMMKPIGLDSYQWRRHCRGLYQTPIAA
jgi:putative transposase